MSDPNMFASCCLCKQEWQDASMRMLLIGHKYADASLSRAQLLKLQHNVR